MTLSQTSPFLARLDVDGGSVDPSGSRTQRRASDLRGYFADAGALERAIESADPVIYEVSSAPVPEEAGEVPFSITTVLPGRVGAEFHMTRGHGHLTAEGEVYTGLSGVGILVLYDGSTVRTLDLLPNRTAYVPPGWAHRSVNVGDEPLRFLAVYSGAAGHDYERVARHGMGARVLADGSGHRVEEDPPAG